MKQRIVASLFAPAVFAVLSVYPASAQVQRTFVSGLGSDSSVCSRTAPCRTFAQALMGTNAGGEVVALDSAGYGAFSITRAVSITAPPGIYAGISVFSGDGIDISASSSETVVLRGLTISNQGSSGSGIVFTSGAALHIESCVIDGFNGFSPGDGVSFRAAANLEVKDSIIRGNNNGIEVHPTSGIALATIDQVRLELNFDGLLAEGGSRVTARNSVASANINGIVGLSSGSSSVEVNVEYCTVSNNASEGIIAESLSTGIATVRVSTSTVTNNSFGLFNAGSPAVLLSRGNNSVEGNTSGNTSGTIGSYSGK